MDRRRITVGIDYGVRRCAIVCPQNGEFWDLELPPGDIVSSLDVMHDFVFSTINAIRGKTAYVCVEAPIVGLSRNLRTGLHLGMVAGALAVAARQTGAPTEFVEPSTWKKAVVGRGNANKEQVAEWLEEHKPELFKKATNQDLIDACCIGFYGEQRLGTQSAV